MNMGTHELTAILKKAAVDEGIVTTMPPHTKVTIGGRIYRQLDLSKYPIGSYEWQAAVDKAAAVAAPAQSGGGTVAQSGGGTVAPPQQPAANPSTTATAGIPGTFDGDDPATVTEVEALTASPTTAWTTGQYVEATSGGKRYWDGSAWQSGVAT